MSEPDHPLEPIGEARWLLMMQTRAALTERGETRRPLAADALEAAELEELRARERRRELLALSAASAGLVWALQLRRSIRNRPTLDRGRRSGYVLNLEERKRRSRSMFELTIQSVASGVWLIAKSDDMTVAFPASEIEQISRLLVGSKAETLIKRRGENSTIETAAAVEVIIEKLSEVANSGGYARIG